MHHELPEAPGDEYIWGKNIYVNKKPKNIYVRIYIRVRVRVRRLAGLLYAYEAFICIWGGGCVTHRWVIPPPSSGALRGYHPTGCWLGGAHRRVG